MTRQEVFNWCKQQYNTGPEYPWNDWNVVLRHTDNQKWYGLIMEVGRDKLGLPGDGEVDILNVKKRSDADRLLSYTGRINSFR